MPPRRDFAQLCGLLLAVGVAFVVIVSAVGAVVRGIMHLLGGPSP